MPILNPAKQRAPLMKLNVKLSGELLLPALIVLIAGITTYMQPQFLSMLNLVNLSKQLVPLLIAAVGQCFVVIGGGLDLSIAALMSLAGVAGVLVMGSHGIEAGLAVMLLTGVVGGLVNGAIIGYMRVTPLIVTLGMMSIAQAIALILSNGVPIYNLPEPFTEAVGFAKLGGVPVTVVIGVAFAILGAVILKRTIFGRYIYAIGSNVSAARKSGVNVPFYTMLIYGFSGLAAGVGAVVLTAWLGAAQPVAAPTLTLESIAAIVLGGVALAGGSGNLKQVVLGTVILGMLSNALNMIGISSYYQMLTVGLLVILAVCLDRLRKSDVI